jgi:SsrA-binding protein
VAKDTGTKLIAENRRSRHDYELLERVEAGIVLTGTEVKALRAGHVQLAQAFADIRGGEMWLIGASISEYAQGNISNHVTDRDAKRQMERELKARR